MNLLGANVQIRSVGWDQMREYSDKWVGQQVKVRQTGDIKTVVHAQMLMGEELKLDGNSWVAPWEVDVITD